MLTQNLDEDTHIVINFSKTPKCSKLLSDKGLIYKDWKQGVRLSLDCLKDEEFQVKDYDLSNKEEVK